MKKLIKNAYKEKLKTNNNNKKIKSKQLCKSKQIPGRKLFCLVGMKFDFPM